MDIINKDIAEYINKLLPKESVELSNIHKETFDKMGEGAKMVSSYYQGYFLSIISKIKQPKNILEIGTFTGYATLYLMEGLEKGGAIYTIDINNDLEEFHSKYLKKHKDKINILIGDALEIIPKLNVSFDIVFIDAKKSDYIKYFDLCINKLNKNGIIISDNVLWSGRVLEDEKSMDKQTISIHKYNDYIANYKGIKTILLPIRDGLSISSKH